MPEMVYGTRCATPGEDLFALFHPFYADCICIIDRVIIYYETFDTILRQRQEMGSQTTYPLAFWHMATRLGMLDGLLSGNLSWIE